MTVRRACMITAMALVVVTACTKKDESRKIRYHVITSIYPVYDITASLAGTRKSVRYVVPPGANPHTYDPVPSDISVLRGAAIFIGINPHFDGWVEEFLISDVKKIYLAQKQANPHVWLSLKNAVGLCREITAALISIDPEGREEYTKNLDIYEKKLRKADDDIKKLLNRHKGKKIIQWHPAWDYFARDYGITIMGTIESGHGDEPSIKEFKDIVNKAKKDSVSVIVVGLNTRSRAVEALKNEINGTIIRLDSVGDPGDEERSHYIDMMLYNARLLADALKNTP